MSKYKGKKYEITIKIELPANSMKEARNVLDSILEQLPGDVEEVFIERARMLAAPQTEKEKREREIL